MAKIVHLFAFVALVQAASALECYTCDATADPTCADTGKLKKVPDCGGKTVNPQGTVGACLKKVYTDKAGKHMIDRKCVLATKSADNKLSYNCNQASTEDKVSVCEVCTQDLCNSAPTVSFSFATFVGVVAAYLIPRYM